MIYAVAAVGGRWWMVSWRVADTGGLRRFLATSP
jgi:hypothetical protein